MPRVASLESACEEAPEDPYTVMHRWGWWPRWISRLPSDEMDGGYSCVAFLESIRQSNHCFQSCVMQWRILVDDAGATLINFRNTRLRGSVPHNCTVPDQWQKDRLILRIKINREIPREFCLDTQS